MVRRLPVLQNPASGDADGARPPWHWVLIGAGFVFTLWIPLAIVAEWLSRALARSLVDLGDAQAVARFNTTAPMGERVLLSLALLGPLALSFVVACVAGGMLVGRFGERAGSREATLAGLLAAVVAWLVALIGGALSPFSVAASSLLLLGGAGAALTRLGGWLGRRRRADMP